MIHESEIRRNAEKKAEAYRLKDARDWQNIIDTAYEEGKLKYSHGVIQRMKKKGISDTIIAEVTDLPLAEIKNIFPE